ncbi:GNA1162 family protein, partial [Vibrio parahaemolyticus]
FLITCVSLLSACQTTQIERQTGFEEINPKSILILPVVNKSVDVDAPLAVYSSLPVMLAEKGYYVYPSNTVKTILEYEGLYEPAEVQALPTNKLADMFGADVFLYVTIEQWDTKYVLISSTTEVEFTYTFKDREGNTIWEAAKKMEYTPKNSSSGNAIADLIGAVITAAIQRAAPDYMPLTRMANYQVFYTDKATYLPNGPYLHKQTK